jgi:8-oxo-dGTP pyrophosphatase MutT (NUDIX family)
MRQILAFEHPTDGLQLIKGSIEPGEDPRTAALRQLEAESGIRGASIARDLGTWKSGHGHVWSLQLCTYMPGLPDSWTHHGEDHPRREQGGQELRLFWHDMHREPGKGWADHYQRALATIRERARALRWRG